MGIDHKLKILKIILLLLFLANISQAGSPTPPYFEFCVSPITSSNNDCTGDGGGGGGYALNEFYVGQSFDAKVMISTGGRNTTGADAVIRFDSTYLSTNINSITFGNLYENYAKEISGTGPIKTIRITGYNTTPNRYYNGTGIFATIRFTVIQQREDMLSTSNPLEVSFDFTPGQTTDSNITEATTSADILNDVENAQWLLWPDTRKPFVDSVSHENTTSVPVETNITFRFKDISPISGDETGVVPSSLKLFVNGIDRTTWLSYTCSGIWGTNNCLFTINPPDIGNRNWNYKATYTIELRDGRDKASPNQNPPGPNIMNPYSFWFETEADIDPPTVTNNLPTGSNNPVTTTISFRIRDIKSSGTYGTGINISTMRIDIYSSSTGLHTYQCGDGNTTCNPITQNGLTWAYDVVVNPPYNFGENEQVLVTVRDTEDFATPPNKMVNFNWSFWTVDNTPPFVDQFNPPKGANNLTPTSKITFHVKDTGVGVDINSLVVRINDDIYALNATNTFYYSGDASDYYIEITPINPFEANKPVAITINVKDNANNALYPEELYAVVYTSCPPTSLGGESGSVSIGGYSSCSSYCPPCPNYGGIVSLLEKFRQQSSPTYESPPSIYEKIIRIPFITKEEKIVQSCLISFPFSPITTSLKINNQPVILGGTAYIEKDNIIFEGQTNLPRTKLILEIHSTNPLIFETVSDENGYWFIEVKKDLLKNGEHKVFAKVIKNGKESEKIHLANLIIGPVSEKVFIQKCPEEKIFDYSKVLLYWLKIVILLGLLVLGSLLLLWKIKKNKT